MSLRRVATIEPVAVVLLAFVAEDEAKRKKRHGRSKRSKKRKKKAPLSFEAEDVSKRRMEAKKARAVELVPRATCHRCANLALGS